MIIFTKGTNNSDHVYVWMNEWMNEATEMHLYLIFNLYYYNNYNNEIYGLRYFFFINFYGPAGMSWLIYSHIFWGTASKVIALFQQTFGATLHPLKCFIHM